MNNLSEDLNLNFGVRLADGFRPKAVYHHGLDFMEYVATDCLAVSERIDEHLTIIKDGDTNQMVGFKLKGFECIYNEVFSSNNEGQATFVDVADVLCTVFKQVGDKTFSHLIDKDEAYGKVIAFALKNKISMETSEIRKAS